MIDITGEKFNKLTALEYVGGSKWKFRCDCGKIKIIDGYDVRHERTRSCGCLRDEQCKNINLKAPGEAGFTAVYLSYSHGAKARGLDFDLSRDFVREIVKKPCYYCGTDPYAEKTTPSKNGAFIYNGIDRVDSDIGYIESNVVPCCFVCNAAKSDRTIRDFLDWISSIYLRFQSPEVN